MANQGFRWIGITAAGLLVAILSPPLPVAAQTPARETGAGDWVALRRDGQDLIRAGEGAQALAHFDEMLRIAGADSTLIVQAWLGQGRALRLLDRTAESERVLRAAMAHTDATGHSFNRAVVRVDMARLEMHKGNRDAAADWLAEALALARSIRDNVGLVRVIERLTLEILGPGPGG